ncbi:MAG: HlyD family efflux transporter periplasmic adaptor subunit [Crocinitomix sp.]|nr:HlyD family efflux transporter periplasmic adaptor subunit [Crocinitomix sp.]
MKISIQSLTLLMSLFFIASCGQKSTETKPIRKDITETVFASGTLIPDDQYNLTSLSDGYLIQLNFEEGDTLVENQLLAVVDNKQNVINAESANQLLAIAASNTKASAPALKQAKINIQLAEQKLIQDEKQVNRYKTLFESKSVSQLEYENILLNLENSKTNLNVLKENYNLLKQQAEQQLIIQKSQKDATIVNKKNNEIRAIIGGKVYSKKKELGDYVRKGDVIAEIGSPDNLFVLLNIDENNIAKIQLKQEVIIELNTEKDKKYSGIVSEIYPAFDDKSQSFYCKVEFTEPLNFKISGTQLQANIIIQNRENVLVIPREYLSYGNIVILKGGEKIKVETGFISSEWVEIIGGIDENTIIIAEK